MVISEPEKQNGKECTQGLTCFYLFLKKKRKEKKKDLKQIRQCGNKSALTKSAYSHKETEIVHDIFSLLFKTSLDIHNGILLSHKRERNNATCSNMDGTRDFHSE